MIPCLRCHRLVRDAESSCPFCRSKVGTVPMALAFVGVLVAGCAGDDDGSMIGGSTLDTSGTSSSGAVASESGEGTTEDPGNTSFASSSETGTDTVNATSGAGFIYGSPDTDDVVVECSLFDQDCGAGEKCAAWANDGGTTLNATHCVPVSDQTAGEGEPCVVEAAVSGVDDCEMGLFCATSDPKALEGTCVHYCDADHPCAEATDTCAEQSESVSLCEPAKN